ncbi:hypothetical protein JB92DRAFT_3097413 [Gautieria morchelliformis]|nr:hypothetical protein JB92DRAFT_3097413 [Gautieria morchelliformis]
MQGEVIPNILKPKGTGGRDFNIRKHMGLDLKDEGDKATYKDVMRSVKLWSNKKLDICQSLRHQESQMITLVELKVLEDCPELRHFQDNWPIKALIRQYLKNSSEQYRAATKQQGQRLQNQQEAEVEIAPPTPIVTQTAAKSRARANSTTVSTMSSSAAASSSAATTKSVSRAKSTTATAKSSTAVAKSVIAAKTTTAGTKSVAPAKASAAKSKLTAKSTVAPKPQAIVKPTTEPKLSITTKANGVTKKQMTKALVPAEAKSTLVKKKAKPTPLFDASSNQDLADPALEMLGFDSAGPKSKVVKGKKKKTSKAENLVIQDITGSNENLNKRKRPAADVENLNLLASLFIAKWAKLAVKGTSQTTLAAKGIPQSKKAMVATIQKVPKASSSTALSASAVRKSKRQEIPAPGYPCAASSSRYRD